MNNKALILASTLLTLPAIGALTDDTDEAIRGACLDYVGGYYEADVERIERGVHPSLQKVVVQGMQGGREVLQYMDRAVLAEYARLQKSAGEREIGVTVFDIYENTAVARIDSPDFVDYAQVALINGEWRIINVLWAQQAEAGDVSDEDLAAIEQAGLDYVDGFLAGSTERLAKALHPRLQKVMVTKLPNGRETFRYTSTDGLIEYARTGTATKPPEERGVEVVVQDVFRNIASIRVNSADFIDFAHVARINGEWVIVNVLWAPTD